MKGILKFGAVAGALMLAPVLQAHDVPNMTHTHAFKQTGYGVHRQGHVVDNENGSIILWSAKPVTGYQGTRQNYARPVPITKAPKGANLRPDIEIRPSKARK